MNEFVKLLIEILRLIILGPDSVWIKIVLAIGLFIWFVIPVAIVCFVIAFVTAEAKHFSVRIHRQ